jgi:uncharacterized DUF497 family protein
VFSLIPSRAFTAIRRTRQAKLERRGNSDRNRLLLVFFVERGESIRIFGARRATNHERNDYQEGIS